MTGLTDYHARYFAHDLQNRCPSGSMEKLTTALADAKVDPNLLLIGRQVPTAFGKFIDLLAIDADDKLVVLELKKNRTPREIVAQLLDYGSWVRSQQDDDVAWIFDRYFQNHLPEHEGISLDDAFCELKQAERSTEAELL
jgi:hypothetical protein